MPGAFPFSTPPNPDEGYDASHVSQEELAPSNEIQEGMETLVSPQDQLPPEAQGETNGGPLGCCLGITVGLMLCIFLGIIGLSHLVLLPFLLIFHPDPITGIRIATGFLGIIGVIAGGYFGWKLGKRFYREYELSPRQKQRLAYLEKRHARR